MPEKEARKRKPKKAFEIDFNDDDVNFDTYFRTTRVCYPLSNTDMTMVEIAICNATNAVCTLGILHFSPNGCHGDGTLTTQPTQPVQPSVPPLGQPPGQTFCLLCYYQGNHVGINTVVTPVKWL